MKHIFDELENKASLNEEGDVSPDQLPLATNQTPGVIKLGTGLTMTEDGTVNAATASAESYPIVARNLDASLIGFDKFDDYNETVIADTTSALVLDSYKSYDNITKGYNSNIVGLSWNGHSGQFDVGADCSFYADLVVSNVLFYSHNFVAPLSPVIRNFSVQDNSTFDNCYFGGIKLLVRGDVIELKDCEIYALDVSDFTFVTKHPDFVVNPDSKLKVYLTGNTTFKEGIIIADPQYFEVIDLRNDKLASLGNVDLTRNYITKSDQGEFQAYDTLSELAANTESYSRVTINSTLPLVEAGQPISFAGNLDIFGDGARVGLKDVISFGDGTNIKDFHLYQLTNTEAGRKTATLVHNNLENCEWSNIKVVASGNIYLTNCTFDGWEGSAFPNSSELSISSPDPTNTKIYLRGYTKLTNGFRTHIQSGIEVVDQTISVSVVNKEVSVQTLAGVTREFETMFDLYDANLGPIRLFEFTGTYLRFTSPFSFDRNAIFNGNNANISVEKPITMKYDSLLYNGNFVSNPSVTEKITFDNSLTIRDSTLTSVIPSGLGTMILDGVTVAKRSDVTNQTYYVTSTTPAVADSLTVYLVGRTTIQTGLQAGPGVKIIDQSTDSIIANSRVFDLDWKATLLKITNPNTDQQAVEDDNAAITAKVKSVLQALPGYSSAANLSLRADFTWAATGTTTVTNSAPIARNITITANANPIVVGTILTFAYEYFDSEGDPESDTTLAVYRATDVNGTGKTAIAGQTSSTYTVTASDQGKTIGIGIIPKASAGTTTGSETFSSFISIPAAVVVTPPTGATLEKAYLTGYNSPNNFYSYDEATHEYLYTNGANYNYGKAGSDYYIPEGVEGEFRIALSKMNFGRIGVGPVKGPTTGNDGETGAIYVGGNPGNNKIDTRAGSVYGSSASAITIANNADGTPKTFVRIKVANADAATSTPATIYVQYSTDGGTTWVAVSSIPRAAGRYYLKAYSNSTSANILNLQHINASTAA